MAVGHSRNTVLEIDVDEIDDRMERHSMLLVADTITN